MTVACPGARPGDANADLCNSALVACERRGEPGPLSLVRWRVVGPGEKVGDWQRAGTTCFPDRYAEGGSGGGPARPQVTMAMIRQAFARTDFAKPAMLVQPKGNATLVGLPTYFQASFPGAGYGPGEVNTVTLLGQQVRIRPRVVSYTFDHGDGTSTGPTTSAGGPYPTGDVTHTYEGQRTVQVRVTTVYGGDFSVDGGRTWSAINGTATVSGPGVSLRVLGARNQLVK